MTDETQTTQPTTEAPSAPAVAVVETQTVAPIPAPVVEAIAPPALDLAAEIEAMRAKTAELELALAKERGDTRAIAFQAAFDRAGVAPAYRDFLRQQIGDVDPRSEAGLAAIDAVAKRHPAMLAAHVSTEDPMAAYLRAKTEEAKASGKPSMWGLIPPGMLQGYDVRGGDR